MWTIRHIVLALALIGPFAAHAETKEEWIALGARIHGAFGPFIPVGIRIGWMRRKSSTLIHVN